MDQYPQSPAFDASPANFYNAFYGRGMPMTPPTFPLLSRVPSPTTASIVAQRSSMWQDRLEEHCQARRIPLPSYNVLSDRRGKRTAWSCTVQVSGQNIPARYWYDGQYVNTAKEDAAEAALNKLMGSSHGAHGPNNGSSGLSQQGRVVGWER